MADTKRLLIKELAVKEKNDTYIRENFRRIEENIECLNRDIQTSDTVVNNYNTIVDSGTGSGDASAVKSTKIAGEDLSALKVVALSSANEVVLADKATCGEALAYGVTLTAGIMGANVEVLNQGILEDPFFSYPLNDILFLDSSGNITNVAPTTGFSLIIGKSLGPGSIYVDIDVPIEL